MSACRRRRRSFAATLKQSWVRAKHDWKNIPKAFQHVQRRLTKWRPDEALRGVSDTTQVAVEKPEARDRLGRVHTKRSTSKMSANEMNPRKITSSFSKREKMRRNPFNRRNSLSISLRLLYISRSYSHG